MFSPGSCPKARNFADALGVVSGNHIDWPAISVLAHASESSVIAWRNNSRLMTDGKGSNACNVVFFAPTQNSYQNLNEKQIQAQV
jgi:hypothetical protein